MSDSEDYLKKKTCEPQTGALLLCKVYEKSGVEFAHWSKLKPGLAGRLYVLFQTLAGGRADDLTMRITTPKSKVQ